jgi:Flp pilus assembly protein TadG
MTRDHRPRRLRPAHPHRRHEERGAALVEFALVLPLLLAVVLGGISGGTVASRKQTLTHAAREGARYGAIVAKDECRPTSNCGGLTWAQLVRSAVIQRSGGLVSNTNQVCVALVTGSGTVVDADPDLTTNSDGTRCYDDGGADGQPRVQVKVTRAGEKINAVFYQFPVTLVAESTARFEQ